MTREEAIKIIENIPTLRYEMNLEHSVHSDLANALYMAILALKQPERVHGRWIRTPNLYWKGYSNDKCSVCGWLNTTNVVCYYGKPQEGHSLRYCPNCSAKMDEVK